MNQAVEKVEIGRLSLAGATIFLAGGLYGWSGLIPALGERYGTSVGDAGMVFSLAVAAFTAAILISPLAPARLKGMRGISTACLLGAGMLVVSARAPSFGTFVAAFSVGFGAASGSAYILGLAVASRSDRPILHSSVLIALFGTGGAVLGPLFRLAPGPLQGLDVLLWPAGAMAACALPGLFMRHGSENDPGGRESLEGMASYARRRDVRRLWLVYCLGSMAGLMAIGLTSSIVEEGGGSQILSAAAIFAVAVGNSAGRLSVGLLSPLLPPRAALRFALAVVLAGLPVAGAFPGSALGAAGLATVGLGYGFLASAVPALTRELFGERGFHAAFAVLFTGWGVAGLASPWLSGVLFDATGSFISAIALAWLATAIGLLLSLK